MSARLISVVVNDALPRDKILCRTLASLLLRLFLITFGLAWLDRVTALLRVSTAGGGSLLMN